MGLLRRVHSVHFVHNVHKFYAMNKQKMENAKRLVAGYVEHYNTGRLPSEIRFVTPKNKLEGWDKEIFEVRDRKLD